MLAHTDWKTNLMGCIGIIWRHHKYLGANAGQEWRGNMKHELYMCIFHIQEQETGTVLRVYFNRDLMVAAKCQRDACVYCLIAHSSYQQGQFSFSASYWWNSATGMERLRTWTGLYTFCELNTLMDSLSGCLSTIQSAWKSKINLLKFKAPWSHLRPRPLSCIPLSPWIVKNVCDSATLTMSVSVWWLGPRSTRPQVQLLSSADAVVTDQVYRKHFCHT